MDGLPEVSGDPIGEGRVEIVGQQAQFVDGVPAGGVVEETACFPYDAPLGRFRLHRQHRLAVHDRGAAVRQPGVRGVRPYGPYAGPSRREERAESRHGGGVAVDGTRLHSYADLVDYLVSAVDLKMLRVIVATIMQGGRELGAEMSTDLIKDAQALLSYVKSDINAPTGGVNQEGVFRLPQQSEGDAARACASWSSTRSRPGIP